MKRVRFQRISIYLIVFLLIGTVLAATINSDESVGDTTNRTDWWNNNWKRCKIHSETRIRNNDIVE